VQDISSGNVIGALLATAPKAYCLSSSEISCGTEIKNSKAALDERVLAAISPRQSELYVLYSPETSRETLSLTAPGTGSSIKHSSHMHLTEEQSSSASYRLDDDGLEQRRVGAEPVPDWVEVLLKQKEVKDQLYNIAKNAQIDPKAIYLVDSKQQLADWILFADNFDGWLATGAV